MTESIATFTITIKDQADGCIIEAKGPNDIYIEVQPFPSRETLLSPEQEAILTKIADERSNASAEEIQQIGTTLFKGLFEDTKIDKAFYQAQGAAQASNGRLRLRLEIEPPELAALPWEAMFDGQAWLSARRSSPMVRRFPPVEEAKPPPPLQVSGALRILFVGASPQDQRNLDIEAIATDLEKSLQEAVDNKKIVFDALFNATLDELQQQLVKDYHIVYIAAHGSPQGVHLDDGFGEVEEIEGQTRRGPGYSDVVSAERLAQIMEGQPTRLVFLAACNTAEQPDSAEGSPIQPDSVLLQSFAETLTQQANLPAIVAMQYFMSDMQANKLTAQFFATIAAFDPVDVALAEARKTTMVEGQVGRDVLAPVMYLQVEDSHLFKKATNWFAVALTVIVPLLVIAIFFGYMQSRAAQERARAEFALNLAQEAVEEVYPNNPLLGLRLVLEAYEITPKRATFSDTIQTIEGNLQDMVSTGQTFAIEANRDATGIEFLPGSHLFVLERANRNSTLGSVANGMTVTELSGSHSQIHTNPYDPGSFFIVDYYGDTRSEIRNVETGSILEELPGSISQVFFNPYEPSPFFVVDYQYSDNGQLRAELRDSRTGAFQRKLTGDVSEVSYNPNTNAPFFVVQYSDRDELLNTSDGSYWGEFEGSSHKIIFGPHRTAPLLIRDFGIGLDQAGGFTIGAELRSAIDGELITPLPDSIYDVHFSPHETAPIFVLSYFGPETNAPPDEIRYTGNGELSDVELGYISSIHFSLSPSSTFFISDPFYANYPSERRRIENGEFIDTLPGNVNEIFTSTVDSVDFFVIAYDQHDRVVPGELRSVTNGELVRPLLGDVLAAYFGSDEASQIIVVDYWDEVPDELRHISNGEVITTTPAPIDSVYISPSSQPPFFIISYEDERASELRDGVAGDIVMTMPRHVRDVQFNTGEGSVFFTVHYDNRVELWQTGNPPSPLTQFQPGFASVAWEIPTKQAGVVYDNGKAYLIDLEWLQLQSERSLTGGALTALACYPFNSEVTQGIIPFVEEYLDGTKAQACPD